MAKITFLPQLVDIEVVPETKVLVAARRAKVPIRFGCASCKCGTCAVEVGSIDSSAKLSPMGDDERALLSRMGLVTNGSVRLSCRAKILEGNLTVDLAFQDTYSADDVGEWSTDVSE